MAEAIPALVVTLVETGRKALETVQTDPEMAVHDFRRYMKMARAALRLGRDALDKSEFTTLNSLLREAQSGLSSQRDEDALIEICGWLEKKQRKPVAVLLSQVAAALRARENAPTAMKTVEAVRQSMDLTARAIGFLNRVSFRADLAAEQVIAGGIRRCYAAGRKCFREISAGNTAQEIWHTWRKRAKDLRYQAGFISPVWPAYCRVWEEEMHHLTDYLGRQRDLFLLAERLQRPEMDWPEPVRGASDLLLDVLEKARADQARKALTLGRKLYLEPPKWWFRRVEKLWRVYRDLNGTDNHV